VVLSAIALNAVAMVVFSTADGVPLLIAARMVHQSGECSRISRTPRPRRRRRRARNVTLSA
jgi:hypothetical protein